MRTVVAIPVYNEQQYVDRVLSKVLQYADDVLVIDDGSTDQTPVKLAHQPVEVIRHARNRGYGQSLIDAMRWAQCNRYDWIVTMDCDEQHEPATLPDFYQAMAEDRADIISGSRYLEVTDEDQAPPAERRAVNAQITTMVNHCLDFELTDAFCGFKACRVSAMAKLTLTETGYAFPMQFWVQAAACGLTVAEIPVRLIYNDPDRSFGGELDDVEHRLEHYRKVFRQELAKFPKLAAESPCGDEAA
ncbi:MAG: glycosyltransferase family 2 protein [Phycisphaeraceae bacterium]|nr:glycosyltransferase family 2 protein [Phycisphaeraceae bacterium]